ncbi:hypothetical protein [Citrobacter freundii]|uniref:hypothetical protein n=1 Tax=Citrobacter freundii TaxID=546 RepID=UPI003F66F6FC
MSNKYEDLIKNARVNAECGEHMSPEEVTTLLNVVETTFAALAAENAGLKGAFDKPQAYLSWHAIPPTWEDPLPCGEYLDVHDEAGHKNSDGTDCWPVYAKPEIETQATDAFLAEVRAQGADECVRQLVISDDDDFSDAPNICAMVAHQLRKGVQS